VTADHTHCLTAHAHLHWCRQ